MLFKAIKNFCFTSPPLFVDSALTKHLSEGSYILRAYISSVLNLRSFKKFVARFLLWEEVSCLNIVSRARFQSAIFFSTILSPVSTICVLRTVWGIEERKKIKRHISICTCSFLFSFMHRTRIWGPIVLADKPRSAGI